MNKKIFKKTSLVNREKKDQRGRSLVIIRSVRDSLHVRID